MVIFDTIAQAAIEQKKNILVVGSPRSGSHALGSELVKMSNGKYLGEICKASDNPTPWNEIELLYNHDQLTVGQIVQLTAKIYLARDVATIKHHNLIVNIRRKNKVKQFASWIYFRVMDPTGFHGWHNHLAKDTRVEEFSVEAKEHDIIQFMLEQLIDDYFLPDFNLCYEDLTFTQTLYQKNEFPFPIENIFSNLDYVKEYLGKWQYSSCHFNQ